MSLNGLDHATIREAHEAAAAEPGGWFLLKYASRDEIDVYTRGSGGIVEIRNAIAKYEEQSPLYGFLKYRRRNVILKYQPESCSRLVQARAAVHFNAVCDRFSPYDTTFEMAEAKDLKDTKLSAACSLHTQSGSTSSSTSSLRRRRLMEITEEEEEERERKRQSVDTGMGDNGAPLSTTEPPVILDSQQIHAPQETNFASTTEPPTFSGGSRPTSPTKSDCDYGDRLSSQSARPNLYSYSSYTYGKPKVRLAPRPSLDINKRPHTAGNFRPVATVPAGFKISSKGSKKGKTDDQTPDEDLESSKHATKASQAIPEPHQDSLLPPRPATSSGASMKSVSSITLSTIKENKMTPEKARLMKAMKLRQQKQKMNVISDETVPANDAPRPDEDLDAATAEQEEAEDKPADTLRSQVDDAGTVSNADSGIAIDFPTPMTVDAEAHTEDTCTDSRPASPTAASSEIGDSTKASSLSESTDETIQHAGKESDGEEEDIDNDAPDVPETLRMVVEEAVTSDDHVETTPPVPIPEPVEEPKIQTIEGSDILVQEDAPVAQESLEILETKKPTTTSNSHAVLESTEESREANTDAAREETTREMKLDVPTQGTELPPKEEAASAPSPYDNEPVKVEQGAGVPVANSEVSPHPAPIPEKSSTRKILEPIKTDLAKNTPFSEVSDPLLDDDALLDELQAARVEEAVMVSSKSPTKSSFPPLSPMTSQSGTKTPPLPRSVSNPMRGPLLAPADIKSSSARSVSAGGAAFLHNVTRQSSNAGLQAKKNNLGSSISQRIKALEQLSGKPKNAEEPRPRSATPSSTFFTVRKQSVRDGSKSPSIVDRANSMTGSMTGTMAGRAPTPDQSREASLDNPNASDSRRRSGSVASRLSMFEVPAVNGPGGRPESIQVIARIVRDPNQSFPWKPEVRKEPADFATAELKQSPLVIDHQRAEHVPPSTPIPEPQLPIVEAPKETIQERRLSKDRKSLSEDCADGKKRRPSLSIVKDFIKDRRVSLSTKTLSTDNLGAVSPAPTVAKSPSRPPSAHHPSGTSIARRLSISSRRSSFNKERDGPTLMSPSALNDAGSGDDDKSSLNKTKGRASRFMRRLSNSFVGASRKNTTPSISPTVAEEEADSAPAAAAASKVVSSPDSSASNVSAYLGEVNVQFPENLLWKRRSMCLDSQGFLILSAVQGGPSYGKEKTGVKRYHLSDFQKPYVPDVELQELPNSVVLDFVEGSGLQIACEDRQGQLHLLHILEDAHRSHSSFGQ
ncbi:uncharacterized protein BCR38DRAFT_334533 [Pseudomassariella vexata]|uniref:ADF-H domain-containing protein n=1 Tax=Pseudomassariella vexata TaxID=1141098 RepID=A0A1Y2EAC8_9PEZI|nr:uncharacterized protein BCR38DRAFT_334533 [Pseudomassariella vexata]ORY68492.1 hypothetical protein BCR38DRAFT_334533 [Pseudomassariella vexata]